MIEKAVALLHNRYLLEYGLFNDGTKVTDIAGEPLPWFALPAIDFLKERVPSGIFVFEFGCGYGSIWWARRARKVVSIEHDEQWLHVIGPLLPSNVNVVQRDLKDATAYASSIRGMANIKIDILIIDGRHRVACTKEVLQVIDDSTVIIFDNANRTEYIEAYELIRAHGYKEIPFWGLVHGDLSAVNKTSIYYKSDNCLGL